jgi:hypothetical protein
LTVFFLVYVVKVRNELISMELKELKTRKWTRFVRITEMELRDNFRCIAKFISQNP